MLRVPLKSFLCILCIKSVFGLTVVENYLDLVSSAQAWRAIGFDSALVSRVRTFTIQRRIESRINLHWCELLKREEWIIWKGLRKEVTKLGLGTGIGFQSLQSAACLFIYLFIIIFFLRIFFFFWQVSISRKFKFDRK